MIFTLNYITWEYLGGVWIGYGLAFIGDYRKVILGKIDFANNFLEKTYIYVVWGQREVHLVWDFESSNLSLS